MQFHILYAGSVSACFELENGEAWYAPEAYDVLLDGERVLPGVKTNVFSLFDLVPGREYRVTAAGESLTFRTRPETACLNVRDFGAAGDGITDDTFAIQAAVNCCPPGGRVQVPAGNYHIRPLVLKSRLTFELCEGAALLADTDEAHYPILPGEIPDGETGEAVQVSSWEGCPSRCHQSILSAFHAEDVSVVGRGIIDGRGGEGTWWIDPKNRTVGRPKLVFFNSCTGVVFHGITGRNSPSWNFHPFFCKKIGFYDMAVEAPANSPNTDGTDPESCEEVSYIGVRFSVGDDAIAVKSGKIYMGMKYQTPTSRLTIRNCLMEYAHGAVVLGSEMSGGVRDLSVTRCLFDHTDRGIRIKTRRGRGKYAVIDGVTFEHIRMDHVRCPLVMNMYYYCDPDGHEDHVQSKDLRPVDEGTPYLGAFTFRDMLCTNCEWAAGFFYGLPEQPIAEVTVEDTRFTFMDGGEAGYAAMMDGIDKVLHGGLIFNNVGKVRLRNVLLEGQEGDKVIANNVGEVC